MMNLIEATDEQMAQEEWDAREADVLADADFSLDPDAVENMIGLGAIPFYGELASEADRAEFENWLEGLELSLSWERAA